LKSQIPGTFLKVKAVWLEETWYRQYHKNLVQLPSGNVGSQLSDLHEHYLYKILHGNEASNQMLNLAERKPGTLYLVLFAAYSGNHVYQACQTGGLLAAWGESRKEGREERMTIIFTEFELHKHTYHAIYTDTKHRMMYAE